MNKPASVALTLRQKIILLVCGVAFIVAFFVGGVSYFRTTQLTLNASVKTLAGETQLITMQFKDAYEAMEKDVLMVSYTPAVRGILRSYQNKGIDPLDGSNTEMWKARLETIFYSVMETRPYYNKIRFIGIAENGKEIVRVNRTGKKLETVADDKLQEKGDEFYFKEALKLNSDNVYFTGVTYNREHGKVDENMLPVLRVINPVFDRNNNLFGMVIINVDYRQLIQKFVESSLPKKSLLVTNEVGDYITYNPGEPISSLEFHDNYTVPPPKFLDAVINGNLDSKSLMYKDEVIYYNRFYIGKNNPNAFLGIALTVPKEELLKEAHESEKESFFLTLLLITLSIGFTIIITHRLMKPLQDMAYIISKPDAKSSLQGLPIHFHDEIGDVARAFQAMAGNLLESEAKIWAVIDNTVDGIVTISEHGVVESFNKACEKIFGYEAKEVIGKNVKMLMPDPYHSEHDGYLKNYRDTSHRKIIGIGREVKGRKKDGSTFPLDLAVSEVNVGKKRTFTGIIRDITEHKESERELKDLAERLSAVMNTVPDGIITINHLGEVQTFNKAAEAIFGYQASEVIGNNVKMLMPNPYHEEHNTYIQNYLATGNAKVIGIGREVEAKRKDNSTFPMELSINEMTISSGRMFVGIIRDITEKRQAETDLKGSEARYSAIIDNTVDGIISIDEMGNIETFNKACEEVFGYAAQEVVGKNVKMLMPDPYHVEHDGYLKNYKETGHRKIIGIGREVKGKRKDGSTFPIDLAVSEVKVGKKRTFTGIIRDITERKVAEAKQQEFVEKIAESNEDLERFAYICSHDLQEPLRMVRSYAQKIEIYFKDKELDEKARKYLHYVVDGAARAQHLINDILAYSRMDFDHKQEVIDLNEVLASAKTNLEVLIDEKEASVRSDQLPVVLGNRVLMIQLLQNLINNAIKYCEKKPEVKVMVEEDSSHWKIAVNDNGIGIPPEYYRKVFIIFERLHKKSEYSGTGIGLAICKKIVERHKGEIWVESEQGKGSSFIFTLPKKSG